MNDPTQALTTHGRVIMARFARWLNKTTGGKLKPSHITTLSLLGHFPAGWALWTGRPILAAALIAVFASMDAIDGALAREQGSASKQGMFYDAVTDRLKEVILYSALGVFLARSSYGNPWLAAALAGTSLLVSYVKAKGEMALSGGSTVDPQKMNRAFSDGLARYEVRMAILIIGLLLLPLLTPLLRLLVALNLFTAAGRFTEISKRLASRDADERIVKAQK